MFDQVVEDSLRVVLIERVDSQFEDRTSSARRPEPVVVDLHHVRCTIRNELGDERKPVSYTHLTLPTKA